MFLVHPSQAFGERWNSVPHTAIPNTIGPSHIVIVEDDNTNSISDNFDMDGFSSMGTAQLLSTLRTNLGVLLDQRGGGFFPAGYHPFGYKITALGEQFLGIHNNCLECDVGRFIASMKTQRKSFATLQQEWLEIIRVSKSGQIMRIYRTMRDMIDFCLAAGLID